MQLADIFAMDAAAYAVMSNRSHVVLRLRPDRAQAWSAHEVAQSDGAFYSVTRPLRQRPMTKRRRSLGNHRQSAQVIGTYGERLTSLSWIMGCLNENIARRGNREDGCKGRFWEGRFKSIALLDDAAKKMIYLAVKETSKGWTKPILNWRMAMNRFMIEFEDRLTPYL